MSICAHPVVADLLWSLPTPDGTTALCHIQPLPQEPQPHPSRRAICPLGRETVGHGTRCNGGEGSCPREQSVQTRRLTDTEKVQGRQWRTPRLLLHPQLLLHLLLLLHWRAPRACLPLFQTCFGLMHGHQTFCSKPPDSCQMPPTDTLWAAATPQGHLRPQ